MCVIATISIEQYLFYIILAISKNCRTALAFVNGIDQFVQYCLCDFFLMNFAGTRAKNLSVNPEKSQGESDRQTVERCRT